MEKLVPKCLSEVAVKGRGEEEYEFILFTEQQKQCNSPLNMSSVSGPISFLFPILPFVLSRARVQLWLSAYVSPPNKSLGVRAMLIIFNYSRMPLRDFLPFHMQFIKVFT
jgi:hypothetical protein